MVEQQPRRICATDCRRHYGLTDDDMAELPCIVKPNPYYRSAGVMRLFVEDEVALYARAKVKRLAEEAVETARRAVERDAELRARAIARFDAYRSSEPLAFAPPRTGLPLDADTLGVVLARLAGTADPAGVRGPLIVARDLCNAAAACRQMRAAARDGFEALGDLLPDAAPELALLLSRPRDARLPIVRDAAASVGAARWGNKPDVVCRILDRLGLRDARPPAHVDVRVLAACAAERRCPEFPFPPAVLLQMYDDVRERAFLRSIYLGVEIVGLANSRVLLHTRFASLPEIEALPLERPPPPRVRRPVGRPPCHAASTGEPCRCGNTPSRVCGRCARCCDVVGCRRHG